MTSSRQRVQKIVSGGQTGVDRAALDAAIAMGIPHGGWCPRGRLAEDGPIAARYDLQETESREYRVRTERNVVDSDATLILYRDRLQGGTLLTYRYCEMHDRPLLLVDLANSDAAEIASRWLRSLRPHVLNVAGPRERPSNGVYEDAKAMLEILLARGEDDARRTSPSI